ncbi:LuxR family two component transcriptional regulator [Streptomyces sp. 2333.5]|uniref:response regulator transcription factor n=1 Tax=unclassified Streptomyces TaxID=2593676 RepID=UPI00089750F1|nr:MULTISPECIES: response regulator transcription factor [unclassified Streptomyces]PJJ02958.1 LuxR family two component transcriptional regulator [Streptomyces sp. 2333.5]SED66093.1 two component transcriptional regulator, LuxR family [Streptomyces sp. 2314.4]SEE23311.1 two component transcriptional regulator, LuxR family [Streptomyces sp. 2112.2]
MIRVLLVDDDALVRAGLRMMLASATDIEVVGEAADGGEVVALVERYDPDLVLMDIRMPSVDGLEATRLLRARPQGRPEIVMLTTFTTDNYVLRALQAGAAGFLLKHTHPDRIIDAVRRAVAGEPVMSPEALHHLIGAVVQEPPAQEPSAPPSPPAPGSDAADARRRLGLLGGREREVARAVAEGKTNAQIATELYMSVPTVKSHVSHILTKLELNNRVQIALLVYRSASL